MTRSPFVLVLIIAAGAFLAVAVVAIALSDSGTEIADPVKQEVVDRLQATVATQEKFALEHPEQIPRRNPTTLPTVEPTSWSVGIVENGQAPIAGMVFGGRNSWSWDLNGNHVVIYAGRIGAASKDAGRGVLLVLVTAMDLSAVPELSGTYEAPAGVGPLRVTSYEGTLLTVEAETGETFYFDANTREFTDDNGNAVPTDTPTPTYVPHTLRPTISPEPAAP